MDIKIYPDPVLLKNCESVEKVDDNFISTVSMMVDTMRAAEGIGLAAPQVGITKRLFVVEVENKKLVCINPTLSLTGDEFNSEESCLSIPDISVVVKRRKEVILDAFDEYGKRYQNSFTGLFAVVIQHEFDHLNGVLITGKKEVS